MDCKDPVFVVQVFLDVVESVNILVNSNGQIIRSDVVGALKMRTYLRYSVISTSNWQLHTGVCVPFL